MWIEMIKQKGQIARFIALTGNFRIHAQGIMNDQNAARG